jgi:diaminopimelate epimerase
MSAGIPIVKMSGAGNDFVVLDEAVWTALPGDRRGFVRGVCRRGLSVGADGVLVVGSAGPGRVRVTFMNPDGGEAFCGNGSRCAARYAISRGFASGPSIVLETSVGDVPATIDDGEVALTLAPPEDRGVLTAEALGGEHGGRFVLAGVPHLVLPVASVEAVAIERVAPALRRHPALGPGGANVDFVERTASGAVRVRTWERGVEGETLACGTGAVAAAFAARLDGAAASITVAPRSGIALRVVLPGEPHRPSAALLIGDARFVFEGSLSPEGLAATP